MEKSFTTLEDFNAGRPNGLKAAHRKARTEAQWLEFAQLFGQVTGCPGALPERLRRGYNLTQAKRKLLETLGDSEQEETIIVNGNDCGSKASSNGVE